MDIIVDTNVIRGDRHLKGSRFASVFDYLEKTDSELILLDLVVTELREGYRRDLQSATSKVGNFLEKLEEVCDLKFEKPNIDVDQQTETYISLVLKKLGVDAGDIKPLKLEYLNDAIFRATKRIRPCNNKGEEIRDALIWSAVLDHASQSNPNGIAFISENTDQFAEGDDLHPQLKRDLEKLGLFVEYYSNLGKFLESKGKAIGWLTEQWISEHVDVEKVNELAIEHIKSDYRYELKNAIQPRYDATLRDYDAISVSLFHDRDFFVYERSDGTLYVEANYYGSCLAEIIYETKTWQIVWVNDDEDFDEVINKESGEEELDLSATVSFVIAEEAITSLNIVSLRF